MVYFGESTLQGLCERTLWPDPVILAYIHENWMFTHPAFYIALLILSRKMDEKQMAELGEVFLSSFKKKKADGVLNTTCHRTWTHKSSGCLKEKKNKLILF